jgi:CRISPR-associated protein Cas2
MVYPANNEQGLDFRVRGQEWKPVDYEGLKLIMRPNSTKQQLNRQDRLEKSERSKGQAEIQRKKTGWSKVSRYRRYAR